MALQVIGLMAEGEKVNELPMSPVAYGLIAVVVFAVLLGVTFAFRSVANRHGDSTGPEHH